MKIKPSSFTRTWPIMAGVTTGIFYELWPLQNHVPWKVPARLLRTHFSGNEIRVGSIWNFLHFHIIPIVNDGFQFNRHFSWNEVSSHGSSVYRITESLVRPIPCLAARQKIGTHQKRKGKNTVYLLIYNKSSFINN